MGEYIPEPGEVFLPDLIDLTSHILEIGESRRQSATDLCRTTSLLLSGYAGLPSLEAAAICQAAYSVLFLGKEQDKK